MKKKEMIPLADKENKSYEKQKVRYICKNKKKRLSKFDERFIKSYDGKSDKGNFVEVDVEHPKNLFSFHSDLPF